MGVTAPGKLYQDPLLSTIASNYRNRDYIADRVLTPVEVPLNTFKYLQWDAGMAYDVIETVMSPKATPNQIEYGATKADGTCEIHAVSDSIDPEEQAQAGGEYNLATIAAQVLTDKLLLKREMAVAAMLRDTAVLTNNTTLAGNSQWSNANSDPQLEIQTRAAAMPWDPNILILGRDIIPALVTHPKVRDAFRGTSMPKITLQWLAEYLGVEEIIVGGASYNSAAKGQARVRSSIWGKDAILAYRTKTPVTPLVNVPTLGYIVTRNPGGSQQVRIYNTRVATQGTGEGVLWQKAETSYKPLVTLADGAFLLKAAVA